MFLSNKKQNTLVMNGTFCNRNKYSFYKKRYSDTFVSFSTDKLPQSKKHTIALKADIPTCSL